jgi:hypothetical protein
LAFIPLATFGSEKKEGKVKKKKKKKKKKKCHVAMTKNSRIKG